jgi:hypothetical protein
VYVRTPQNALTAFVQPGILFNWGAGATVDITLRIGMPQLELGAFATSVIPTTTAAATRAADVAVMTGANFSNWYRQDEGTLFVEASNPQASIYKILAEGATSSDFKDFTLAFDGLRADFSNRLSTGQFGRLGVANSLIAGATVKVCATYTLSDAAMAFNGALATITTATTQRISADRIIIGGRYNNTNMLNGHIRRIGFFPKRLSNIELQRLTS